MTKKKILSDAENVIVKNNRLIAIGEPINKSLPKYQYMGILKIIKKDFFKLKYFYNKIQNKKIDFTNFINLAIKKKIIKFKVTTTSKFWYEIDNFKDVQILANKKKW